MEFIETLRTHGARLRVHVERAYDFDEKHGLWMRRQEEEDVFGHNLILNAGRVTMHTQMYGTSGILTNGFNYIGLAASSNSPVATDTTLSSTQTGELSGNGLTRTQGLVTLPTGSGTMTTIANTFTYTGSSQAIGSTALFTASSLGIMNHEINFTIRTLFTNDTLTLTFTITTS
jgi:hypothetical protein